MPNAWPAGAGSAAAGGVGGRAEQRGAAARCRGVGPPDDTAITMPAASAATRRHRHDRREPPRDDASSRRRRGGQQRPQLRPLTRGRPSHERLDGDPRGEGQRLQRVVDGGSPPPQPPAPRPRGGPRASRSNGSPPNAAPEECARWWMTRAAGQNHVCTPALARAQPQLQILAVEEDRLVERPQPPQRVGPRDQRAADRPAHPPRRRRSPRRQRVAGHGRAPRRRRPAPDEVGRRRRGAGCTVSWQAAVAVEHAAAPAAAAGDPRAAPRRRAPAASRRAAPHRG